MKFSEIPIGTLFRFSYAGLPPQLASSQTLGPFRKVAADGAVDIADPREVKLYVAPAIRVVSEAFEELPEDAAA
jgi:hypothetical protein